MKTIQLLLVITSFFLTNQLWAHGGDDHKHETREQIAWQLIDNNALLIDVRTDKEFTEHHLPDAQHIPYKQIVAALISREIKKDTQIVLYCRSGNRAGKALKALHKAGFTKVHNAGGLNALLEQKSQFSNHLSN